jgi:hypothetical protein
MRIAILSLLLVLSGCTTTPVTQRDQLPWAAISAAEAYVARNGYTSVGHPKDLPVERVEIFDALSNQDQIVAARKNTLEPLAFGIQPISGGRDFYVLFRMVEHSDRYRAVLVQQGLPVQVLHESFSINERRWSPVQREQAPPNNSFKPKPLRGSA